MSDGEYVEGDPAHTALHCPLVTQGPKWRSMAYQNLYEDLRLSHANKTEPVNDKDNGKKY